MLTYTTGKHDVIVFFLGGRSHRVLLKAMAFLLSAEAIMAKSTFLRQHWDLNPGPAGYKSSALTTKPRLLSMQMFRLNDVYIML